MTENTERKTAIIAGILIIVAYGTISSLFINLILILMCIEIISGAAVLALAIILFPILKPHNKNLTIGYTIIKSIEGILIIVAAFYLSTSNTEMRDWIYNIGIAYLFGTRFLILSYMLFKSKLVPRFISVWGVIASLLFLAANLLGMMGLLTDVVMIFQLPVILNEITLAIWLMAKGFNKDAIISRD